MSIKNGQHMMYGYEMMVEDGRIVKALRNGELVHIYKWDSKLNAWNRQDEMLVSTFRANWRKGTLRMA